MLFLLPLWLTLGRGLLGISGWGMIFELFYIAPVLFVSLLVIDLLISARQEVKQSGKVSKNEAMLLGGLYLAVFFYGFFELFIFTRQFCFIVGQ